jgi:hypothetical protein
MIVGIELREMHRGSFTQKEVSGQRGDRPLWAWEVMEA